MKFTLTFINIIKKFANAQLIYCIIYEYIVYVYFTLKLPVLHMRRFTSTAPARGTRAPNRAISNSCL